jgi:hypothetical protein
MHTIGGYCGHLHVEHHMLDNIQLREAEKELIATKLTTVDITSALT